MTAALLFLLTTVLGGLGLLCAVHAWRPAIYVTMSARMAGWCTFLTLLALVLRDPRLP